MAVTTYSELKASIASWIARSDLTAQIPDFISFFEAMVNRKMRARQMLTTATLTPSSGAVTLPSDFLAVKTVIPSGYGPLEYRDPNWIRSAYTTSETGTPQYYTIEGSSLVIRPATDQDVDLEYYQKVPVLSDSNTTNWLLTAYPDLYVAGSLVEAHAFIMDAEKAAIWSAKRDIILDEIEKLNLRFHGPMAVATTGPTP
jgi:hypothetical protein